MFNEKAKEIFVKCQLFVGGQKGSGEIVPGAGGIMVASGPVGHLGIAVSNLLDAASSETMSDEEVLLILGCAEKVVDLGM